MSLAKLKYYFRFFPLTPNFFLGALGLYLSYQWLDSNYLTEDSSFAPLIALTGKLLIYLIGVFIAVGFLSVIISWVIFMVTHTNKITIKIGEGINQTAGWAKVKIEISNVLRPFLGYVKIRLFDDKYDSFNEITMESDIPALNSWIRSGISGQKQLWLYDRKVYHFDRCQVYFQDYFRLFSFGYLIPTAQRLYTTPPSKKKDTDTPEPNSSETQENRVLTIRKVEGEWLNYKNYEASDDPRRIVWKIYAKNKELVIKTPEIFNPFASHITWLPSFYQTVNAPSKVERVLLNFYKDKLRILLDSLLKNETPVKLIHDQPLASDPFEVSEADRILYQITASEWQQNTAPSTLLKPNSNSIVCISSLCTAEEIERLPLLGPETIIFYVKLSEVYRWAWLSKGSLAIFNILFRIEDNKEVYQWTWLFSGTYSKVKRNEKLIEKSLSSISIQSIRL